MWDKIPVRVITDERLRGMFPALVEIKRSESLILLVFENGKRVLFPLEQTLGELKNLI